MSATQNTEYDWKCNCCRSQFLSAQENRTDDGTQNGGAKCPVCKAEGQFTYRVETRPTELRQAAVDDTGVAAIKNPNISYERFKVGEYVGDIGYDVAEKIRSDLWFLSRLYGFVDEEKDRIDRMNVLLNHIDVAHKKWNRAALQPAAQKTEGAECCDVDLSETIWHDKYHTLCEQSWKALGISEYTGLSIPEHISALASRASVDMPDGWKLVPIEPTDLMVSEGVAKLPVEWKEDAERTWDKFKSTSGVVRNIYAVKESYKAMLSAAKFPELVGGRE